MCVCRLGTQILQSFIGSSTSVSRAPGFKVLVADQGSPLRTEDGLDALSLVKDQVGRTVAPCDARLVARPDLVPVAAGLGAAGTTGVIHGPVLTLGGWGQGHTGEMDGRGLLPCPSAEHRAVEHISGPPAGSAHFRPNGAPLSPRGEARPRVGDAPEVPQGTRRSVSACRVSPGGP